MHSTTCDTAPPQKFHLCPKYLYSLLNRWAGPTVLSLLLLMMRVVFGHAFYMTGHGKVGDISKVIIYFKTLHISMPVFNAYLVSYLECYGGILLMLGIVSRPLCIAFTINMLVAYITTEREALGKLWNDSNPIPIFNADPFWFLVTALLVLACGPGWFSLDAILGKLFFKRPCKHAAAPVAEG